MAIKFNRSQTFATNGTVTAAGLHNLVDGLDIYQALITDQTNLTSVGTADELLIADADLTPGDAPKAVTVQELFNDALTVGTYTDANFTANLTYGTATGNRTVSTSATITTGTINNATLGTTTGTLATFTNANVTNGTVQTLTSSTATITGGTFSGSVNSTAGTIGTLNSTTGTITNLSTTLAGDLTISQGTATLGTTGVTAGTYGTNTSAVTLTLDAKGRVTTVSTSAIQTTPADGSITYAKLSTSATEADNVAKRTAKAWVNFNGTGTVAIRDDFNISSITDNGAGDYTLNFSNALEDINYAVFGNCESTAAFNVLKTFQDASGAIVAPTTSAVRIVTGNSATNQDPSYVSVGVLR